MITPKSNMENKKYFDDLNRLLVRKSMLKSNINDIGNKMFVLKNEKTKYSQEHARIEKEIIKTVNKYNEVEYIEEIKKDK